MATLVLLLAWARWWPMAPLFDAPTSTLLLDRNGVFLAATVARDGQWRMPAPDSVPLRFERCITEFEDRRFRKHFGIRIPSLLRAARQNIGEGRTVSGGSTLTMQVARMALGRKDRTVWNKLLEMGLALRLELRCTKDDILQLHTANAPFGGNVVGLEAAAWRWFGKAPHELGWAESATLAVLPNAPSRIHPGRNRAALKNKRDRLLDRLLEVGAIDRMEWSLSKEEPLPEAPLPLPRLAPQLLGTLQAQGHAGKRIRSTVDRAMQARITDLAARYASLLRANEVHHAAVLVLDVATGEALAYVGNLPDAERHGEVDLIRAPRSTGSLLKPFLHAAMLQAGERMPDQLVADLPTSIDGFSPRNYDGRYTGAVPASAALARSLNVPAVRALREHGVERTRRMLVAMGMGRLNRSANHYGLSLIVGGGESSLWELTGAYASMARVLTRYAGTDQSVDGAVHGPTAVLGASIQSSGAPPLGPGAIHHTMQALQQVNRPETERGWQHFAAQQHIAWKTGTSFGHRDAWAIGVNARFAVGVWTGNASGEGRPGLTGTLVAAPLLFDVFGALPQGQGFDPPYDALEPMYVCPQSGYRAGPDCPTPVQAAILHEAMRTPPCPYHRRIVVNASGSSRVQPDADSRSVEWFALPPAMEYYYMQHHPGYRPLPPLETSLAAMTVSDKPMQMIYPEHGATLFIPTELSGESGRIVLRAAHRMPKATVHWDIDGQYHGSTSHDHQLAIAIADGEHRLTLTDDDGARIEVAFRTVSTRK
ncbi:MAG: penicillin-binding protein 1C [Flavobacteriales bacterium]